jgi:DNA-binding GntR family transcriptional regulator
MRTRSATRLTADGLIRRDPDRGYVIVPFDTRTSDETFDARCAIELGVIDMVVGRVPQDELPDLRNRVETMAALLVGNRFVDFDRYLDANYAFHEVSCRWPTTARSLRRSDG